MNRPYGKRPALVTFSAGHPGFACSFAVAFGDVRQGLPASGGVAPCGRGTWGCGRRAPPSLGDHGVAAGEAGWAGERISKSGGGARGVKQPLRKCLGTDKRVVATTHRATLVNIFGRILFGISWIAAQASTCPPLAERYRVKGGLLQRPGINKEWISGLLFTQRTAQPTTSAAPGTGVRTMGPVPCCGSS